MPEGSVTNWGVWFPARNLSQKMPLGPLIYRIISLVNPEKNEGVCIDRFLHSDMQRTILLL